MNGTGFSSSLLSAPAASSAADRSIENRLSAVLGIRHSVKRLEVVTRLNSGEVNANSIFQQHLAPRGGRSPAPLSGKSFQSTWSHTVTSGPPTGISPPSLDRSASAAGASKSPNIPQMARSTSGESASDAQSSSSVASQEGGFFEPERSDAGDLSPFSDCDDGKMTFDFFDDEEPVPDQKNSLSEPAQIAAPPDMSAIAPKTGEGASESNIAEFLAWCKDQCKALLREWSKACSAPKEDDEKSPEELEDGKSSLSLFCRGTLTLRDLECIRLHHPFCLDIGANQLKKFYLSFDTLAEEKKKRTCEILLHLMMPFLKNKGRIGATLQTVATQYYNTFSDWAKHLYHFILEHHTPEQFPSGIADIEHVSNRHIKVKKDRPLIVGNNGVSFGFRDNKLTTFFPDWINSSLLISDYIINGNELARLDITKQSQNKKAVERTDKVLIQLKDGIVLEVIQRGSGHSQDHKNMMTMTFYPILALVAWTSDETIKILPNLSISRDKLLALCLTSIEADRDEAILHTKEMIWIDIAHELFLNKLLQADGLNEAVQALCEKDPPEFLRGIYISIPQEIIRSKIER